MTSPAGEPNAATDVGAGVRASTRSAVANGSSAEHARLRDMIEQVWALCGQSDLSGEEAAAVCVTVTLRAVETVPAGRPWTPPTDDWLRTVTLVECRRARRLAQWQEAVASANGHDRPVQMASDT